MTRNSLREASMVAGAIENSEHQAARVDGVLGIHERVEFFGSEERLFAYWHEPLADTLAHVIICPSISADFDLNYEREVRLSRALAARGVCVLRFHYRGTGNSDGEMCELSFDGLSDDVLAAVDYIHFNRQVQKLTLLGRRWGALTAAAASGRSGASLALWDPVVHPVNFFEEGFRVRMMFDMKSRRVPQTVEQLTEELMVSGLVDLMGFPVFRRLYESSKHRTLLEELGNIQGRVLLMKSTNHPGRGGEFDEICARCAETGLLLRVADLDDSGVWWFEPKRNAPDLRLLAEVADLLTSWCLVED